MTLDISLEAIEADLAMAERGGQVAVLALARAQVRATLLAPSSLAPMVAADGHSLAIEADHQGRHEAPETPTGNYITWHASADIRIEEHPVGVVYIVPSTATWDDRVTAAARLLKVPEADLVAALEHLGELIPGFAPVVEANPYAGEPEEEPLAADDDMDADFFAEARKARKKK